MIRYADYSSVDLTWIAKMIQKNKIDIAFVERFTLYEARPSWDVLKAVIEKSSKVDPKARAQLMYVIKGLLGEEAAGKLLKGLGHEILERGYDYGGKKSIDIIASTSKSKFIFGEVKNYNAITWTIDPKRQGIIEQLKDHNEGIRNFINEISGNISKDIEKKVLLVEEKGFTSLDSFIKNSFQEQVEDLGWKIEFIPSESIGDITSFIDKLR
jgi:hypothetical protein